MFPSSYSPWSILRLALLMCLGFCAQQSRAAHGLGADIQYTCLGGTTYEITLNLYRECSGIALLGQDLIFTSDCGTSFTVPGILATSITEVSQLCAAELGNSSCNGGTLPGVELWQFTTIQNLANCDNWTIGWAGSLGAPALNTVINGTYVEAVLSSATAPCNSSPVFTDGFIPYVCVGQNISYNFAVSEPDGDSLVYALVSPQWLAGTIPTPVGFQAGFTAANPFPVVNFDPVSGQMNFMANVTGIYRVAILVEEYNAAGQFIGSVIRDLMIIVLPCTGSVPTFNPLANNTGGTITGSNSMTVCDGEQFCVDVEFADPDAADVLSVSAVPGSMPPGATLTITGMNPAVATVCWTADINESPVNIVLNSTDGACPIENRAIASIAINVFSGGTILDPGNDVSVNYCQSDPPVNLFSVLNGTPDPGGNWTFPNGQPNNGTLNPLTDPDGGYTYTLPGVCGGPDVSAVVSVSINALPDPGVGGNYPPVCTTSPPFNLFFALQGTPDLGGTWTGPSGASFGGIIDPATDPPGNYTYTVAGVGQCPNQSTTLNLTWNSPPNAGLDTAIVLCDQGPTIDLFNMLGGNPDPGGSWNGPNGAPVTSSFTPGVQATGNYTYSIPGAAPCGGAFAVVSISTTGAGNPGVDSVLLFCGTPNVANLFAGLGGTPDLGGTWTDPLGNPHSGVFNPVFDPFGVFTYTIAGSGSCPDTSATVSLSVVLPPDAGFDATISICAAVLPFPLLDSLGGTPNAGGTWTNPNGLPFSGTFVPGIDILGVYTYTVVGAPPCTDQSATLTVQGGVSGNPGISSLETFCENDPAQDLLLSLGGTPDTGGSWTDPNGLPFTQPFDPATDSPGAYTYTIAGTGACPGGSANVVVSIDNAANAGEDSVVVMCTNGTPLVDLFTYIGGAPNIGGTWTDPNGNPFVQPFDPSVDPAGAYTYSVVLANSCPPASSVVTVQLVQQANAGTGTFISACENSPSFNLINTLSGPDPGGVWTDPNGIPVLGGVLDPSIAISGLYTYTISAQSCPDAQAQVNVVINSLVSPGNDTALIFCQNDSDTALFNFLGGNPDVGGTWTYPNGSVFSGLFDPAIDPPGVYTYLLQGPGSCLDDSALVAINTIPAPNPGLDGNIALCANDPVYNLINALGGAPAANGSWTDPNGVLIPGTIDPSLLPSGTYTYTVNGILPCAAASATVQVSTDVPANAGADTSIALCSSDAPLSLFNSLGGNPVTGGTWTAPGGIPSAGLFDPSIDPQGVYTYTVPGTGNCGANSATVTVAVNTATDAGGNGAVVYCNPSPAGPMLIGLSGTPQFGGTWTDPSGNPHPGIFDSSVDPAGNYTYTVSGTAPCPDASAVLSVGITPALSAGNNSIVAVCSDGQPIALIDSLGGTPDAGGTWSDPNGNPHSGQFDPAFNVVGSYTYNTAPNAPCPGSSATVQVAINPAPNAGTNGTVPVCATGGVVALFPSLNGTPDLGGAWTDPNGNAHSGQFDPLVDAAGTYTYTVTGTAPCAAVSAQVQVSIVTNPNAGLAGTATVCSNGQPFALLDSLGGTPDAGGIWSDPNGNPHSGQFDPATDIAGNYTYSFAANPPCLGAAQIVAVNIIAEPNAGANGTASVCATGGVVALFPSLNGTPDLGGAWTDPNGNAHSGQFDPLVDAAGTYTYTVTGAAPCIAVSAQVQVSIVTNPNAGLAGTATVCSSGQPFALLDSLGGTPDAGGTWSDPNGNPHSGQFDPATDIAGNYTYSFAANPPCLGAAQIVAVNIIAEPIAGANGTVPVCATGGVVALFPSLNGTPDLGGAWTDPNGNAHSGQFDPLVDAAGTYTYTVTGVAPCIAVSAQVQVSIVTNPNAGLAGTATICSNGQPFTLLDSLGGTPDAGGTWSNPNGNPHSGQFDPATDIAGNYTYSFAANPPCLGAAQIVAVNIIAEPNAGANGTVPVCATGGVVALFPSLNGTPDLGGTWTGPNGNAHSGQFDPLVDAAGTYTYTVSGAAPCVPVSAQVQVSIVTNPNAGLAGTATICSSGQPFALLDSLGGTPDAGGTWSDPNGNPHSGQFDPALDVAGNYTYSISATPPCSNASAIVSVGIITSPNAGSSSTTNVCAVGTPVSLINILGGTPDPGGIWVGPNGPHSGIFDPALDPAGTYTYTVTGVGPCPDVSANVAVTITNIPSAGTQGNLDLCANDPLTNLFAQLGGNPDLGGFWTDPNGNAHSGQIDPSLDPAGNYTYTIAAVAPCPGASQIVAVNIFAPVDAGLDGSISLCSSDAPVGLFSLLGGTPNSGGSWTDPNGALHSGSFDPSIDIAGVYTYNVTANAPCNDASSTVTVNVQNAPNAGTSGSVPVCAVGNPIALFPQLLGADPGGIWTDPNGLVNSGLFDPAIDVAGLYTYTLQGLAPCGPVSQTVNVSVVNPPDVGTDSSLSVCTGDPSIALFNLLGGSPDPGGSWIDPNGNSHSGTMDPGQDPSGAYLYVLTSGFCPDDTAEVLVNVLVGPNAGNGNVLNLCSNDPAFQLTDSLNGNPDANGSWFDQSGSPISANYDPASLNSTAFTYVVPGNAFCPDDSSMLVVSVTPAPNAGTDSSISVCTNEPVLDLNDLLGGNANSGGAWTNASGVAVNNFLDPASDTSGVYAYTVLGTGPCSDASAFVTIAIIPIAEAGQDSSVLVCSNDAPFQLVDGLGGSPAASGLWYDNTGVQVGAVFNPQQDPAGDYLYVVTQSNGCGSDSANLNVQVVNAPNPGIDGSASLCANDQPFNLIDSLNGLPALGGQWTWAGGQLNSGVFDPQTMGSGVYYYVLPGVAPCASDSAAVTVDILATPNPVLSFQISPGCSPNVVQFFNADTLVGDCLWDFGNGDTSNNCLAASILYDEAGAYNPTLSVALANGCSALSGTATPVQIYDQPVAGINPAPAVVSQTDPIVYLQNTATGYNTLVWDLGELGSSIEESPTVEFPSDLPDTYEVCQYVYATADCFDSTCVLIEVVDGISVIVPNAFTPDGNGVNDLFYPSIIGARPDSYEFRIYDRWGDLLFFSSSPGEPWDGTYKGSASPQDVYIWRVVAQDAFTGKTFDEIGHVTLVR